MRKNFGAKPLSYPQPVLMIATYNEDGSANLMNAAWGGISEEKELTICLSAEHRTTKNILRTGAYTVSMGTEAFATACDYVGIVSGDEVPDKVARAGLHAEPSGFVDAPLIKELPLALECRMKHYDKETCLMVGEIVNVSADESVLDENGDPDIAKASPLCFDPFNNKYIAPGRIVADAFGEGMKIQ